MASARHSTTPPHAIAVVLAALVLLLAPASALAVAAVDEYSLGPIGGQNAKESDVQRDPGAGSRPAPEQLGVVGENEPARSPLAAAGSGPWIGLALVVVAGIVAAAWDRPPRSAA